MVRRNFAIAFMAGAHVFPGGRVDIADAPIDRIWCDLPDDDAVARGPLLSFAVAAVRELFEESGILVARRRSDRAWVVGDRSDVQQRYARHRDAVHGGTMSMRALADLEQVTLALDAVVPFAHWVTPPIEVRRFDTWFFMARLPEGQHAVHDAHESVESGWFRPSAALDACRTGRINLPPPTWATLREIERFASAADALAWAAGCPIVDRTPLVLEADGGREIVLPGDPRHPQDDTPVFETRFVWADGRWLPASAV